MASSPIVLNSRAITAARESKPTITVKVAAPAAAKKTAGPAATVTLGQTTPTPATYSRPTVNSILSAGAPAPAVTATDSADSPSPGSPAAGPPPKTTATFVAGRGPVVVDVLSSESGYDNRIYWSSDNWKTSHFIGVDNETASVNIGTFAPGTEIEFGIDNGQNQFFRTGGPSQNADGFNHAKVESSSQGVRIGFEDLLGGGDRDFNDAIIQVRNLPPVATKPKVSATRRKTAPPPAKPAKPPVAVAPTPSASASSKAAPTPAPSLVANFINAPSVAVAPKSQPTPDNRSGLGDGTNPGNGAGRVNSPNQGTDNPSQKTEAISKPTAQSSPKAQVEQAHPTTPKASPPPRPNTAAKIAKAR